MQTRKDKNITSLEVAKAVVAKQGELPDVIFCILLPMIFIFCVIFHMYVIAIYTQLCNKLLSYSYVALRGKIPIKPNIKIDKKQWNSKAPIT